MPEPRVIDQYTVMRRMLSGNPERGLPDLWQDHDAGDIYYIKIWRLRGQNGPDIKALWNREVRGLMRLQGYPGASELFVRLHDLRASEDRYYAVLDGGTRILLSAALQERGRYNWLLYLGEIGRRVPLWEGLLRIAEAVSILHSEGTLHRSLSSTAVFTNPDGQ